MTYRLGVDVGGTFTDILLIDEDTGATCRAKTSSTPEDQSVGVLRGIDQACAAAGIDAHRGRRRVPRHDGRDQRHPRGQGRPGRPGDHPRLPPGAADRPVLRPRRPGRLDHLAQARAARRAGGHRRGARSGSPATASVVTELDEDDVRTQLRGSGRQRHRGPEHQPDQLLRQRRPRGAHRARSPPRSCPASRSRCRRRSCRSCGSTSGRITTVANAVRAAAGEALRRQPRGPAARTRASAARSRSCAATAASSPRASPPTTRSTCCCPAPPAASPVPSGWPARPGTATSSPSTWAAPRPTSRWSQDLTPRIGRETTVGDLKVRATSVDVRTVGAGGGSIAHVPPLTQALRVGPQSAGAVPGPAAYGAGGTEPTVTDANVVLGYLPDRARRRRDHPRPRRGPRRGADHRRRHGPGSRSRPRRPGSSTSSTRTCSAALRLVSVQQGFDPRDFALVAFGGAGPLHANALGRLTGAWPVIIPPSPGVLCAYGDATTSLRDESVRTLRASLRRAHRRRAARPSSTTWRRRRAAR